MKRICMITGNRAEFGILRPLLKTLKQETSFQVSLIVTGSHLSPEFGLTITEIEKEFEVDKKIEILLSSDTQIGTCKAMGLAMISFSEALSELSPDLMVVLGDRFEIFAAVSCANVLNIPVAHLHGGEITEAAIDDSMRHAITKLSHLHLAATEASKDRIIQMGECPSTVWNVGSLSVEQIKNLKLLSKSQIEKKLNLKMNEEFFLITFHPETKNLDATRSHFEQILKVLENSAEILIFTKANCDPSGRCLNAMIDTFVSNHPNRAYVFDHLGTILYFSLMKLAKAVIGNSSSGIIEAPSFKTATINIGDRQKGRIKATTIIDASHRHQDFTLALKKLATEEFKSNLLQSCNPYEQKSTCKSILKIIKNQNLKKLAFKRFYDLPPFIKKDHAFE